MTREQAVRWCMERGYGFIELYDGEIVYTKGRNIRREKLDESAEFHKELNTKVSELLGYKPDLESKTGLFSAMNETVKNSTHCLCTHEEKHQIMTKREGGVHHKNSID